MGKFAINPIDHSPLRQPGWPPPAGRHVDLPYQELIISYVWTIEPWSRLTIRQVRSSWALGIPGDIVLPSYWSAEGGSGTRRAGGGGERKGTGEEVGCYLGEEGGG